MSSGDYTRVTFDHLEDHIGVLMQQGRVLLDADFNELVEIVERRIRAGTLDTIGRCAYPIEETPDAFRIQIAGTTVTIGRGRIYVHGLLAENHGKGARVFDPHLGEEHGTQALDYDEQPYLPKRGAVRAADESPMPATGGPHLLYIDVWQREITYLEEPDLVEKAVGVDSTTRLQTAWQVKALADAGGTCDTPGAEIPAWLDLTRPSGGRLTTAAVGVPASDDPCIVNPTGGFRGTENRLYRIEIHEPGPLGTATFKWSRDNGSIAAAVTGINAARDQVTVSRTARDAVLRFSPQDWVEVLDDWHELLRRPGVLRKVVTVDDVAQTLVLDAALPAGEFDTADLGARHTRVRRWDQKGLVLDAANTVVADVDALGGDIPTTGGVSFVLEDGVQATFSLAPAGGIFRTGDYWTFAARTVDASVEILDAAPPRPVHHFCRLAMVTFPDDVEDCRTPWPPDFGEGCCTAVVAPGEDIQAALDSLPAAGGCVCLKAGVHPIRATLRIERSDVCLHGESPGAIVRRTGGATLLRIGGAELPRVERVRVEKVALELAGGPDVDPESGALVLIERADDVHLDDCRVLLAPPRPFVGVGARSSDGVHLTRVRVAGAAFGVYATDDCRDVSVRDGVFEHPGEPDEDRGLVALLLEEAVGPCQLEGNRISGFVVGIALDDSALDPDSPPSSAARGSRIVGNSILRRRLREAPTHLYGIDVAADDCVVADNFLAYGSAAQAGIRLAGRRTRAVGNTLLSSGRAPADAVAIGIVVGRGQQAPADLGFGDACRVRDNRLLGRQVGVWVQGGEGVEVDGNFFLGVFGETTGVALIEAERCRVARNHFASFGSGVVLLDGRDNTVSGNDLRTGTSAVLAMRETGWRALDNTIEATDAAGLLGLVVHGGTRLARNRLQSCVRAPGGSLAMAIGVMALDLSTANEVAIESCEVVDTGLAPGGDPIPQPTWGIFAWAFGCTLSGNLVTYSDTSRLDPQIESRAVRLHGLLSVVLADRRLAFGQAALLGNKLLGVGRSALVEVPRIPITDTLSFQFDRVSFTNNDCFHLATDANDALATVSLQAEQMVAMGNHVRAGTRFFSFHFHGNRRTLFLGNITDGEVLGYPAPRPTPVDDFNFTG
jgi:hypothetical protein